MHILHSNHIYMYGVSIMQAHIYVEKHIIKHAISLNYMQVIVNQNSL
jgi:hypothetical protein